MELPFWMQIISQSYEYLRKSIFSPVHSPCYGPQPTMGCVLGRHRGNWTLSLAHRATVEPTMATTAVAQHGYWVLPFLGREREGAVFGGATKNCWSVSSTTPRGVNTKPRAGLPNPVSVQHHSCSGPPPSLSYKYTYLKKWFLFADAKSRIFQHNSGDHDDIREF